MKKSIFKVIAYAFICMSYVAFSQNHTNLSELYNYQEIIENIENSKDNEFQKYIDLYDKEISIRTNDIALKVQKCYFVGNAYVTEDGYNSKYQEFEECIQSLYNRYPNHPKVLLLKASNLYADSLLVILNKAVDKILRTPKEWENNDKYEVFSQRARVFQNLERKYEARSDYKKAKSFNDSIDISLLGVEIYMSLDDKTQAKKELLEKIDYDNNVWELNQKASYLVDLESYDEAFQMYHRVEEKDSSYIDNQNLSKLFFGVGKIKEARQYLLKDTINEWNKSSYVDRLVNFDLKHSDGNIALSSYRKYDDLSYYNDFFGVKRMQLFFKSPFQPWNLKELSHILILILSFFVLFLAPYLWVLPIHFASDYFQLKPKEKIFPFQWELKHFWMLSFVYLCADFISSLLFNYSGFLNYLFSINLDEDANIVGITISFMLLMLIGTIFNLRKEHYKILIVSKLGIRRTISYFFLFIFINYVLVKYLNFSNIGSKEPLIFLTVQEDIQAIIREYGFSISFLFVVVVVPIYEEVIFRGIILSSVSNKLGFWKANILQAVLFSVVHFNFGLFIMYFFFGFYTGLIARSSKGLLVGIIFHAINNMLALSAIYLLMR